jgi:hypothetical protein
VPSWDDLDKPKPQPQPDEFAEVCARVLSSPDGQKLMRMLSRMTFERVLPGNPEVSALFGLEGQRQLVRRIEGAIERGLANLAKDKDARSSRPKPVAVT